MMQNPENVQLLVQQLATQNPQIAQALGQNPQALMELLGIEISDDADMEGQPIPPGAQVVSVTPEERAAIERVSLFVVCGWLKLK
jgi:UV excision repair protein RAD23